MPPLVELDGEAVGELNDLISGAFEPAELKRLLRIKMNLHLDRMIDPGTDAENLVFELISKLERLGIITDFLRRVLEARPDRPDLRDAIERHCPQALQAAPDAQVTAKAAIQGLDAVKERLDDPLVHNIIAPHHDELMQLISDIGVLANYKLLHDFLQTIQFTHLPQMTTDIRRLSTDEIAATTLEAHIFELDDLCRRALKAAEDLPNTAAVQAAELRWLNKVKLIIEQARQAIDNLDDPEGARALRSLRMTIRPEPSRINGLLTLTAQRLPLERLIVAVSEVVTALSHDGAAPADLRNGLQSLQTMLPQLKGRVAEHEQWQEIENEFLDTDDFVEQGTPSSIEAFGDLWTEAKAKVAALAAIEPAAQWAKRSQRLAEAIDATLAGEMDKARSNFAGFRHTVLFHFFQVDRALRRQCEAILEIKRPLESLLSRV